MTGAGSATPRPARASLAAMLLEFDCPRCAAPVTERFYGPCESCRGVLHDTVRIDPKHVEVEAYAPKMNVVPNQVATKE